jgi:NAD(P)-dependent dehydrogenase (short-subunit alcohol dehydrogenase family)
MARLKDKVAFITGAGSGIGRASAQLFAAEGAQVVIAEIDEVAGKQTQQLVEQAGGCALFVRTDVTDEQSVCAAVKVAVDRFGRINVLYNNVGGSTRQDGRVTEAPNEEFWRVMKVDLFGTWLCCKHVIPELIRAGGGSVINSTSVFALVGTREKDAYTAGKGAISALTRSMAVEYAAHRVRVNAVAPAATATERVLKLLAEDGGVIQQTADNQYFGLVQPHDVAHAALYLASEDARVTTGQILAVDGGFTAA